MTAVVDRRSRVPAPSRGSRPGRELPPLSPRLELVRGALLVLCGLCACLVGELVIVSPVHARAEQQRLFGRLRASLAAGTAPVGPTDARSRELRPGTPVAYLEIPSIHLRRVVVEGTAGGTMVAGPGHRRDTPLPGQAGVSVILGRRGAFGAPFRDLQKLKRGAPIRVTTGSGVFEYEVTGSRREGDPVPPAPAAGAGRLLLATATGPRYMPTGVLRIDAELKTRATLGPARLVTSANLPPAEQMMAGDPGGLPVLALWLQALLVTAVAATWARHHWGRAKTWLLFLSPLMLVGLSASAEAARLLPNLL